MLETASRKKAKGAKIPLKIGLSKTFDWYLNNKKFFNSVSKKLYINRIGIKR